MVFSMKMSVKNIKIIIIISRILYRYELYKLDGFNKYLNFSVLFVKKDDFNVEINKRYLNMLSAMLWI